MRVEIITLFPEFFPGFFETGMVRIARERTLLSVSTRDLRKYGQGVHRKTDDRIYGGGPGLLLMPRPLGRAIEDAKKKLQTEGYSPKVVYFTPQGVPLRQSLVKKMSTEESYILICGRYEGIDQRIRDIYVDIEISIGDYVLTGGELAASVFIDSMIRLIPGVLNHIESTHEESFQDNLLEHGQYTRPETFKGKSVPQILLSGNHQKITEYKTNEKLKKTTKRRPDLISKKE